MIKTKDKIKPFFEKTKEDEELEVQQFLDDLRSRPRKVGIEKVSAKTTPIKWQR